MNATAVLKDIHRRLPLLLGRFPDIPGIERSLKKNLSLSHARLFYFAEKVRVPFLPSAPGFEAFAKPDLIRKLQNMPRPTKASVGKVAAESFLFCPVVIKKELAACLVLGPKVKGASFTTAEMELLEFVVERIALRIRQENLWEELAKANRRALAGWISSAMIHEIRNPLSALNTLVQLLPRKRNDEVFLLSFESLMRKEIERLGKLTEDLLAFSKDAKGGTTQVDLSVLLEHLGRLLKPLFRSKKVNLTIDVPRGLLIQGSEDQLESLFLNLLQNSFKAIKTNGKIEITGKHLAKSPYGKNKIKIEVQDNGQGFSGDLGKKIFDPYFSTDPNGAGLGLVICQRVVENHGGHISVKSAPRKGALFSVFFPKFIN